MANRPNRRSGAKPDRSKTGSTQESDNALTRHEVGKSGLLFRPTMPQQGSILDHIPIIEYSPIKNDPKNGDLVGDAPKKSPLPPLPQGLSWPKPRIAGGPIEERERTDDDYDVSEHFNKKHGLKTYLDEKFPSPLLSSIDMPTFRDHWPTAAKSIDRQRAKLEADGLTLPAVKKEVTNRLAAETPSRDRPWHIQNALKMRAYRARRKVRIPG